MPGWGYLMAALLGCFLITLTWATLLTLAERDRHRGLTSQVQSMESSVHRAPPANSPTSELTIYTLQPGCCYEVKQTFRDYYGNPFALGERLTYQQRHFLPYDGGHTVIFAERTMYLQEEVNRAILDGFADYLVASTVR